MTRPPGLDDGVVRAPAPRRRRPPRIALVAWHSSPLDAPGSGSAGGMNVYVRELAGALARGGARVDIVTAAGQPGAPPAHARPLAPGVRLVALRDEQPEPRRLGLERYDVVHSHYWQSAPVARRLAEHGGGRFVHTFHTFGRSKEMVRAPGDVVEPRVRLDAEDELLALVDGVVTSTRAERSELLARPGARGADIHVVAPGVDPRRFRPLPRGRARAALGLGEELLVVHVGRLQPLKRVGLAVRALARLGGELPRRCVLALAGGPSGPRGPSAVGELRAAARGLPAGVEVALLGPQPQRALPALLAAADATVVCSRWESFCLAALEAQACGAPVVGTAVGGLPDLIADGASGRVVAAEVEAFALGLADVLLPGGGGRGPAAPAMRQAALAAARPYRWAATAGAVREIYGR